MLKELLKKLFGGLAEASKLMAEGKQDEAIAKMQDLSKEADNVDLDAVEGTEPTAEPTEPTEPTVEPTEPTWGDEDIEKFSKEEVQALKKWASLNVDAQDMATLISNLQAFIAMADGQAVQKATIETLTKKVEELEAQPISKQAQEDDGGEVNKSKSPFAGMLTQAK